MSAGGGRRVATVVLIVLLLGPPLLMLLPGAPGAVRVAGVALVWWYAGLVAPLVAGVLATLVLATSSRQ